ncbi:histidine kinase dimerization/phosphoacceptor domain -containing protein [Flavobacterium sp.]|uniref:sensor histidine kinase n=1 Tax=Flavobacterium sp. TaxID=239 RepID=UPI00262A1489|nr:histidine kinase dimerization/phosphoacceptor domain -containing protein [Flavobacterium sp.]
MVQITIFILAVLLIIALALTIITFIKNKRIILENQIIKIDSYDKEQAIKEANHRVKNNLQLINSLLSYQAREYKNQDVDSFLLKGQKRINSIILLHENFDINTNNNKVNLKKYIEDLFDFFTDLFEIEKKSIQFHLNTNDIQIDIETALPLGIVLNELICNSLIHAFPYQNSENKIKIDLLRADKNKYHLIYKDNGCGFLYKTNKGLGLKIIDILLSQIDASYTIDSSKGTTVTIVFTT